MLRFVGSILVLLGAATLAQEEVTPAPADSIVVWKAQRELRVYQGGQVTQASRIALARDAEGDKLCQGDRKTPEGRYKINFRNAQSLYHLSLRISYPSAADRRESRAAGCDPGGEIMIHGSPNSMPDWGVESVLRDWTAGCVALTNEGMDSVWSVARVGTIVVVHP